MTTIVIDTQVVGINGSSERGRMLKLSVLFEELRDKIMKDTEDAGLNIVELANISGLDSFWLENFFIANSSNEAISAEEFKKLLSLCDTKFSESKSETFTELSQNISSEMLSLCCLKPNLLEKVIEEKTVKKTHEKTIKKIVDPSIFGVERFYFPFLTKKSCISAKEEAANHFLELKEAVSKRLKIATDKEFMKRMGFNQADTKRVMAISTVAKICQNLTFMNINLQLSHIKKMIMGEDIYREMVKNLIATYLEVRHILTEKGSISVTELFESININQSVEESLNEKNSFLISYLIDLFKEKFGIQIANQWHDETADKYIEDLDGTGFDDMILSDGSKISGRGFARYGFQSRYEYMKATQEENDKLRKYIGILSVKNGYQLQKLLGEKFYCGHVDAFLKGFYLGYETANLFTKLIEKYWQKSEVKEKTEETGVIVGKENGKVVKKLFGFSSEDELNQELQRLNAELLEMLHQLIPSKFLSVSRLSSSVTGSVNPVLCELFLRSKHHTGYEALKRLTKTLKDYIEKFKSHDTPDMHGEPGLIETGQTNRAVLEVSTHQSDIAIELGSDANECSSVTQNSLISDRIEEVLEPKEELNTALAPSDISIVGLGPNILTESNLQTLRAESLKVVEDSLVTWIKTSCEQFCKALHVVTQLEDLEMRKKVTAKIEYNINEAKIMIEVYAIKIPGEAMALANKQREMWKEVSATLNQSSPKNK